MNKTEYLLVSLGEECAELAKEASKALRFGLDDVDPHKPGSQTNAQKIFDEFCDVFALMGLLVDAGLITVTDKNEKMEKKRAKVAKYMDYARSKGTLI